MTINTMKSIRLITFLLMFFHWNTGYTKNMTIYDFSFEDIDGNSVYLNKFPSFKPTRESAPIK